MSWYSRSRSSPSRRTESRSNTSVRHVSRNYPSDHICRFNTAETQDEMFGFLIGGHDTTSGTMRWGFKYLADNPSAQHKLRQELHSTLTSPTLLEITKAHLPYLDAFIEETLRHSLTAQTMVREAKKDTQILGHHIPKGTEVWCMNNAYGYLKPDFGGQIDENKRSASSRDAKDRTGAWDVRDMHLFKPERWLKTSADGRVECDLRAGPSMPFGAGPRGCFGMSYDD